MDSLGFINAKITCKDCGSQAVQTDKPQDGYIFKCKCQQFDISRIDLLYDDPEKGIAKLRKAFDSLNWELEALE